MTESRERLLMTITLALAGALILVAMSVGLQGCGPSKRSKPRKPYRVIGSIGVIDVLVDPKIPTSHDQNIAQAVQLAVNDWALHLRQPPPGVNPPGNLPAQRKITLYVSLGPPGPPPWRSFGESWGWADLETGEIRLQVGNCRELPGLFHGLAHVWGKAAGPPHDPTWFATDVLGDPIINYLGGRVDWAFIDAWDQVLRQYQRNANGCP